MTAYPYLLIYIGLPLLTCGLLTAIVRRHGPRRLWLVTGVLGVAGALAMLLTSRPYEETSPVSLALMVLLPLVVASGTLHVARRLSRVISWVLASAFAIVMVGPGYMLGCVVPDWLPLPGCFF